MNAEHGSPKASNAGGFRPSGTVVFLFTDVEGSTRRWETDPAGMAVALRRHDELVRAVIERHGGYVFKTVGDAFCAAFWTGEDALGAALGVQRQLAEESAATGGLRVRAALHAGATDERDGDYFGQAVNRVARLLSAAHGGQIVVSGPVAQLVHGLMPPGVSLRDLGEHRLKDLTYPERVYQLEAADLPGEFPPLNALNALTTNLPLQHSALIAREREVGDVVTLLRSARLVTIAGAGGVGKTRVAIQAAAEMLDGMRDGVWFFDFAPLTDPAAVASEIGRVFGVHETPGRPALDATIAQLMKRSALLVLDNCEHVIEEATRCAEQILLDCAGVSILATSRESLNISAERVYRMPSLAVPPAGERLSAEQGRDYGALQLFVERAKTVDAAFALTDANISTVADIVRRLDGIPLAIELAAARVKVLSVQTIDAKLDERFRLLTGGSRTALPRHQTMRALIDWSYELLSEPERSMLRRLSVFAGGFTLGLAVAMTAGDIDEYDALDLLTSLVEKSLVLVELDGEEARYRLLESNRQYAREKLAGAGEAEGALRGHALAMLDLAKSLSDLQARVSDREWRVQAGAELDNFRAALTWSLLNHGDLHIGQQLAAALTRTFYYDAPTEGRRWIALALQATEHVDAGLRATLLYGDGALCSTLGLNNMAQQQAERSLLIFEELGDRAMIAAAKLTLAGTLMQPETYDRCASLLTEALETARALGIARYIASGLVTFGLLRKRLGDIAGARQYYAEGLEVAQAIGADGMAAHVGFNLAEAEFAAGEAESALSLMSEASQSMRATGAISFAVDADLNSAAYLIALERWKEAEALAKRAITEARECDHANAQVLGVARLAAVAGLGPERRLDRAARLFGFAYGQLGKLGVNTGYTDEREKRVLLASLEEALGKARFAEYAAAGDILSFDAAVNAALEIEMTARLMP